MDSMQFCLEHPCVVGNVAGEEERQKAHEALEAQEAELARYAEQVAGEQQQAAALQARIKAMEEKARSPFFYPSCCTVCTVCFC